MATPHQPSTWPLPQFPRWHDQVGQQRDWIWRGWQTRYTYLRSPQAEQPPLLILHGFGASIGHWRQNLPIFAQHHPVYALDFLGFGASEKAATTYNVQLWVEQVYHFWQTLIGRPVVLVGNSIGSLVALALAATHPEMVTGLAMLSLPDTTIREEMIPARLRNLVTGIESLFTAPALLKSLFYWVRRRQVLRPWASLAYANPAVVTDELLDIFATPAYDRGAARTFAALIKAMTQASFGPSVKATIPRLNIPILLIWGQQDRMIPPALGRQFAQYNPRLKLVELEQAGHCPHDEQPERVNQEILDWLALNVTGMMTTECEVL